MSWKDLRARNMWTKKETKEQEKTRKGRKIEILEGKESNMRKKGKRKQIFVVNRLRTHMRSQNKKKRS